MNSISNIVKIFSVKFGSFLKTDGWLFALLLILNLTIFWEYGLKYFYFGAVGILILCVVIHFLLSKFPRTKFFLQMLILIGFAIFFVTDVFLLYKFNYTLKRYMIQIILATNPATVKEFFQNYVFEPAVILGVAVFIFLIKVTIKFFRKQFQNLSEQNLRRISHHSLIMLLPAGIISIYWIGQIISMLLYHSFSNTILGRNIVNTYSAMEDMGSEMEVLAEMNRQDENIISNNSKVPYVVFILGESARRDHMQLYGYNLETTPLLNSRYKNGELFKFNDVIACANHTTEAMELMFTFTEKDSVEKWYKTPNLFDILRRAGYHTAWISNQTPASVWGNMDSIYSSRCDEKFFEALQQKNVLTRNFDSVLIPPLEEFISNSYKKNFYLIHLYGSHPVYTLRYPAKFAKFTAADEVKTADIAKKLTAEFDNTILYNDFVLDEIFKRFEDKNALIIYISDHGQELFEDGREFSGHSDENTGNRGMIEIPMLIWTSKSFREMYPEKIVAMKNSADNPYRLDFIIHTILDLMDIRTESFDATKSIVNEKFDKFRQRIYNGKTYTKN